MVKSKPTPKQRRSNEFTTLFCRPSTQMAIVRGLSFLGVNRAGSRAGRERRWIDAMDGDWLKLHRSILDSEVFSDDWLTRLWIWCLCKANYVDGAYRGQPVRRGQFVTGRITAADELKVSPSKWYRGIQELRRLQNITVESNSNWTTITICNFDTYQNGQAKPEQVVIQRVNSQRTASDTTIEQPADTIEEGNKSKKGRREEGKKETLTAYSAEFENWWSVYPQKKSKADAFKAWPRAVAIVMQVRDISQPQAHEWLTAITRVYADSDEGRGDFVPHGATWLNGKRWEDDPKSWEKRNGHTKGADLFRGVNQFLAEAEGRLT